MSTAELQRKVIAGGGGGGGGKLNYIHTVVTTGGLILTGTAREMQRFGNN
jgi:hypothetical protein